MRSRAGMSTDYQLTIDNTDMSKETLDWGSYSAGQQVDATLYNIRRERRIELVSEGFRFNDLKRWRALDQVQNVHLQGFNFWESMYQLYTWMSLRCSLMEVIPVLRIFLRKRMSMPKVNTIYLIAKVPATSALTA